MRTQGLIWAQAAELSSYYGLLDSDQQMLLRALAYTVILALVMECSTRALRLSKRAEEEDPIQVVLSQPVRMGRAREEPTAMRPAKERREVIHKPACHGRRPDRRLPKITRLMPRMSLTVPRVRLLRLAPALPRIRLPRIRLPHLIRPAKPEAAPTPMTRPGRKPAEPPAAMANVVAEIDFIRAATADDLIGLRKAFGFVYVHADTYRDALSAADAKGLDGMGIFVAAEAVTSKTAYASIAVAEGTGGIVLSNSRNVCMVCERMGLRCWNTTDWRLMSPQANRGWTTSTG